MAIKRNTRVLRPCKTDPDKCLCRHQRIGSWQHHADPRHRIWCTYSVAAGIIRPCRHPGDGTEHRCRTWAPFDRCPQLKSIEDVAQYRGFLIDSARPTDEPTAELYKGFILVHNKLYGQWSVIGYNRSEADMKRDGNWNPSLLYMANTRKAARAACDMLKGKR